MGASLREEHRVLVGAVLQGFRSAKTGMHEVFKGLFTGFEVILHPSAENDFLPYVCLCFHICMSEFLPNMSTS